MVRQLACFEACHASDPKRAVSLANSAALIAKPSLRSGWVRPGIMLYGDNPLAASHPVSLRAAMHLTARVVALRPIQPGAAVGYDGCWTAARTSLIATLGIGYADGYPRHAPNGTPVRVAGCIVPLVGRVSMDSITVDVTDCAGLAPGAEATLWGPGLPVSQVANYAGTASYELLAGLGHRVTREYRG
jgi:alanine racemase